MKLYFNSYLTTDIIMKKAIIIGASSGIGRGIAIELLNKNYKIAISARRKDKLGEIKLIQPENVIVKAFDSSTEENENNLDELVKLLGGLDLFIYCSGIGIINKELSYQKIKKVNKIVGPGNIFVSTAKKEVFGDVGIDMIAGPSEITVVADRSANINWVASDLIAQAEHDINSQCVLISKEKQIFKKIKKIIYNQLKSLPRKHIATKSLKLKKRWFY